MNYQIRETITARGQTKYSAVLEVRSDGQRKIVSGGTFDSRDEAVVAGAKLVSKHETDISKSAALRGSTTLRAWSAEWVESIKGEVKESTRTEYERRLKNWVLPHLGHIQLAELSPVHIRRWLKALGHIHVNSRKHALDVLKNCLGGAVRDGALILNPAAGLKIERSKALEAAADEEEEAISAEKVWSHEEVQKLLTASTGDTVEPLVVLGLLAGLRPGEVEGTKWTDLDFLAETVTVRRANRKATSTKSGKSRTVKLPFEAVRRLVALQERQQPGSEWVMSIGTRRAAERLLKLCRKAGVREQAPHSCRHTFASLLLSALVPSTAVAKILGHSNSGVTERVYAHALPKNVDEATKVLERLLGLVPETPAPQIPTYPRKVELAERPETLTA